MSLTIMKRLIRIVYVDEFVWLCQHQRHLGSHFI